MGAANVSKNSNIEQECGESIGVLLADRDRLAEFVIRNKEAIRRVARRKLNTETRRVYDSDDIMATVLRRVDLLAHNGAIRADSEAEMVSLILTIAANASISKFRLIKLARSRLGEDSDFSRELIRRLNACHDDDEANTLVFRLYGSLDSTDDRRVYLLRLRGIGHAAIGQMLGITEEATRKRWQKIRRNLAARFKTEGEI